MDAWFTIAIIVAIAAGGFGAYRYFGSFGFLKDFIVYMIPKAIEIISKRASPEIEKKSQEAYRRGEDFNPVPSQDPKRKKSLFGKKTGIFSRNRESK